MKTIDIWTKEPDMLAQWMIIIDLYDAYLHADNAWHFFWEGPTLMRVRCSDKFVEEVIEGAYKMSTVEKVDPPTDWVDEQVPVEKYKRFFMCNFHNNSEFAVYLWKEGGLPNFNELCLIYDRVSHPLINTWFYVGCDAEYERAIKPLELAILSEYLVGRAGYVGRWQYYQELLRNESAKNTDTENTN